MNRPQLMSMADDEDNPVDICVERISEAIGDGDAFGRLTATGRRRGFEPAWEKVTVRPVEIRGRLHLQVSAFDGRQDVTKNYLPGEFAEPLRGIVESGLANFHVQSEDGDLHVRITKRGKVLTSRGRPSLERSRHLLAHNRQRQHLLTAETGRDVLEAVGIVDAEGRVKPTMQAKFRQVNAFLQLMKDRLDGTDRPLHVVDCGCGNAYLTLSAYAWLTRVAGREVSVTGVDVNEGLIAKCAQTAADLGWDRVTFEAGRIQDYTPDRTPDVVVSLHACDTATDEALARAVEWDAGLILAAPCCQQELAGQVASEQHAPVLRHGILKRRTADVLTDALRAQLLETAGYRADVTEFISPEETSKNLLIRAVKARDVDRDAAGRAYRTLRDYWGVSPTLERLLKTER